MDTPNQNNHSLCRYARGRRAACLCMLIVMMTGASALAQTPALPTVPQLEEMMAAKEYRLCLQQIARLLRVAGAAEKYDVPALHLMRGECLLQLEDRQSAIVVYRMAENSENVDQAAEAQAMDLLLTRCENLMYKSAADPNAAPVGVVDPESRKTALKQLREDQLIVLRPAINKAMADNSLKPTITLLPRLIELRALELITQGDDAQVGSSVGPLGEHARGLITAELDRIDQRLGQIQTLANQQISGGVVGRRGRTWGGYDERRGLTSTERNELRDFVTYLTDVRKVSLEGQKVARFWKGKPDAWAPQIERSTATLRKAQDILATE